MRRFVHFFQAALLAGSLASLHAQDATPSRSEILQALGPSGAAPFEEPVQRRQRVAPFLEALEKQAQDKPDSELVEALLRYQLAYPDPEDPAPGKALGRLFLSQSEVFLQAYRRLTSLERAAVLPFWDFGWRKAVEGKNRSLPRLVALQRELDRCKAAATNAGVPDAPR